MPRAAEMIEKIDTREHAPATDTAELSIAAVHPDSFWRDQAAGRAADDASDDHSTPGNRVAQGEDWSARAGQSEAALHDGSSAPGAAGQSVEFPGPAKSVQQNDGSGDQEEPAPQAPTSAGAGFGHDAPAATFEAASADIPAVPDDDSAAPSLASDVEAVPVLELAPAVSGVLDTLDGAIDGATEAVPDVLDTAASALPLTATLVEPVGDLAPGLLQSLFQPEGAGGSEVAGLDPGNLQPLDSGAVDNIAEDAASALPLTNPDALLGSDDHGGPMDGLLDL